MKNRNHFTVALLAVLMLSMSTSPNHADDEPDLRHGREMMLNAFEHEISRISTLWFEGVETLEDWEERRLDLRRKFAEMLGLWPEPDRTDLQVTITGTVGHEAFTVHKLHYQSLPGLYVTANLYIPGNLTEPAPAVLYLCGHASRVIDGYSYGSKVAYQRHPAWYARHGMVSLIIDPLNNGEIQGAHRGTHRRGRWWWYNRGYTPAAIEAWNTIRALDYLESRDDVDAGRIGVTGRSGGGMYSWLLLALDDRVAVATPTAGITDLHDHLIDGVIRGHCDCNYWNNYHRFDTTVMAALAAPRPVRLLNTDDDHIFPTAGIDRIDAQVRMIYSLYGREDRWDVFIGSGGHGDTPELHGATFPWMHRWLKGEELAEVVPAEEYFSPEELRVFDDLPDDECNTRIDERFLLPVEDPPLPRDREDWERMKAGWMTQLAAIPFAGWPDESDGRDSPAAVCRIDLDDLELIAFEYSPQKKVTLRLWGLWKKDTQPRRATVRVVDEEDWQDWIAILSGAAPDDWERVVGPGAKAFAWPEPDAEGLAGLCRGAITRGEAFIVVAVRGIGPTRFERESARGDTIRRSFPLLGQTRDSMRIWDVRSALATVRNIAGFETIPLRIEARTQMAAIVLYASLFDEPVERLDLRGLPHTHDNGPYLLNIDRIFNMPQLLAMARERADIRLSDTDPDNWIWADRLVERFREN